MKYYIRFQTQAYGRPGQEFRDALSAIARPEREVEGKDGIVTMVWEACLEHEAVRIAKRIVMASSKLSMLIMEPSECRRQRRYVIESQVGGRWTEDD